ncbi:hypothetical protein LIOPPNJA_00085 [Robbsia andropogonis]|nr:hypothetical protein [Robbsia andropogonis]MCP1117007.1 hypothetical protein [Robbsia andropogonis]MCP1126314.1 hypothetical protein [Robbsia andropogonis]
MREALEVIRDHVSGADNPLWRTEGHVTILRRLISGLCESALAAPASAQSEAKPVATIEGADEYGPRLNWHSHWVNHIGASLYTAPSAAPAHHVAEPRNMVAPACDVGDATKAIFDAEYGTLCGRSITQRTIAFRMFQKGRELAARHAPAESDALTDEEIMATAAPYCDASGWMNGDQIFAFARAIIGKRGGA